ncbi:MAG: hypothetical protein H7Y86_16775 [Rhizobacter sp.]|nr:hypothetical protein [Ferruginibacter sp.]
MIVYNDIAEPRTKPVVGSNIKKAILQQESLEKQVIVHGSYKSGAYVDGIRIWPTTFLCDQQSAHKSKLIYIEGVSTYPTWTFLSPGEQINFLLVFSGLPKDCKLFDLKEIITEPDGFEIKNIRRNTTDVYQVNFL